MPELFQVKDHSRGLVCLVQVVGYRHLRGSVTQAFSKQTSARAFALPNLRSLRSLDGSHPKLTNQTKKTTRVPYLFGAGCRIRRLLMLRMRRRAKFYTINHIKNST